MNKLFGLRKDAQIFIKDGMHDLCRKSKQNSRQLFSFRVEKGQVYGLYVFISPLCLSVVFRLFLILFLRRDETPS